MPYQRTATKRQIWAYLTNKLAGINTGQFDLSCELRFLNQHFRARNIPRINQSFESKPNRFTAIKLFHFLDVYRSPNFLVSKFAVLLLFSSFFYIFLLYYHISA